MATEVITAAMDADDTTAATAGHAVITFKARY